MIIAIDFDETVCLMLKEIAKLRGESEFDYKDCTEYGYPRRRWGNNVFSEYLLKAHQSSTLEEVPGAITAIKKLKEKHEIYILTANIEEHIPPIKKWLIDRGLDIPVYSAIDVTHKMAFNWNVLIDDHPNIRKIANEYRRLVIQYPQPYNDAYKFLNWKHVPLMIDEIEKLLPSIKKESVVYE